ncbi:WG repeat-containing protein [Bacteroides oleiciplenus]|nr:WG repeat-containing protein [Bacteroides oleiciplenus]
MGNITVTTAYPFINGYAVIWTKNSNFPDDYSCCSEKCGLINDKGEFVIPPIYDNMLYSGGANVAVNIGFKEHERYETSGKWGVADLDNHILISPKYTDIYPWENGLYAVEFQKRWGVIDLSEKVIIPFEYDWISWSDQYGWITALLQGKYGCITLEGEIIIPFIYDEMLSCGNAELIPVKHGHQAYYIDRNGHRVLL